MENKEYVMEITEEIMECGRSATEEQKKESMVAQKEVRNEIDVQEKNAQQSSFWKDERGVGVIEIVLILVVLIALVLVFKEQITAIVNDAFASISGDAGKIMK